MKYKLPCLFYFPVVVDEIQVQADHGIECGFKNIHTVADHYNVYKDLFGLAHFYPSMQLRIAYDIDEEYVSPVCSGNILDPAEVHLFSSHGKIAD